MHILQPIGYVTRGLQRTFPARPIRGLSRLGTFCDTWLPPYQGIVTMTPGFKMNLNSAQSAEMSLILMGMYQPALTYQLTQQAIRGGNYLDVGANLGFFSLLFAQWAETSGNVAAFEVNPQMVARIREANAINGFHIDIVEKAVHHTAGVKIPFYVSSSPGKSSIYGDNVSNVTEQITVETLTIDAYMEQAQWSRLDVIKMDIEGNDCKGLLGGTETIRRFRPFIAFEYWRDTPEQDKQQVAAMFSDAGYDLKILHLNGKQAPFNWYIPPEQHHVDVLCLPRKA